ncbi:FlaD/FlaE family flagellar protein [Methanogenium sp. MK-MG]|uniref:FlaD/FlaE family flagellar protein n=1 Tax=Methanogenium sp. MK-MG TaxID=2599926 RepID=UPI0013ECD66D|nr:FlaD/FlaE family flagellar protein [Methanogenium sp. MK-MG]KAF1078432.1 hypothetical protein MKMG_00680 [Methanogenium sp. MK-MG]
MAINQSQVDQIISSASVDEPEVKLQNLQDEVDFIKKSIKKLLIDIRERMNEMENPFIITALQASQETATPPNELPDESAEETSQNTKPELSDACDPQMQASDQYPDIPGFEGKSYADFVRMSKDKALLLSMQQKMEELSPDNKDVPSEKLRLQKLHRLFEWTNKMVKKYGPDRLEIMIESYRTMGYITDDAYQQVNDIARLMPETLGESHEISSDEFVSELYVLNRILSPNDSSLDRDMIEVLMDMRTGQQPTEESSDKTRNKLAKDEWIDMLDRI